jgi:DNA polymerase
VIGFLDIEAKSEAGFYYDAGLGRFVPIPETTKGSKPGLPTVGAAAYAEHPTTEVVCLTYNIGYEKFWCPSLPDPLDLFFYVEHGGKLEAVNSFFEFKIWQNCLHKKLGWPPLPIEQTRDTSAKARAFGIPGALKKMGEALELGELDLKGAAGDRLIKKFTIPRRPTKKDARHWIDVADEPLDGGLFYDYNVQDVRAEMAASARIPDLSAFETEVWLVDQRINERGVQIDTDALAACLEIVRQAEAKYNAELAALTAGRCTNHAELAKLGAWLADNGLVMPNMQKDTVDYYAKLPDVPPLCRRALEIRSSLNSASVKKLKAIKRQLSSDGRLRGLYVYAGATRTQRWAGFGPQPQNLKRDGSASVDEWNLDAIEAALVAISYGSLEYLEVVYGDPLATVGGCIRGLFISAPGHDFICSDYSAIEAVVLAALAGEQWRLDLFRDGGDIYVESISRITGVPIGDVDAALRKRGKVAELASQYGGWIDAWENFGADAYYTNDDDIKRDILAWRKASPNIVEFWGDQYRRIGDSWDFTPELYGVEGAIVKALLNPDRVFWVRRLAYGYNSREDILYCRLPSERCLYYHKPRLHPTEHRLAHLPAYAITYMGYNSDTGWVRKELWGSKAVENDTQAIARDVWADAMVRLERRGYPIVMHSHDEGIVEVAEGFGSITEFELIMSANPNWCAKWPIKAAGGWRGKRYFKG